MFNVFVSCELFLCYFLGKQTQRNIWKFVWQAKGKLNLKEHILCPYV